MVILDTNILIDHLRQFKEKTTLLTQAIEKFHTEGLAISIISIQELYEGKSTREQIKERELVDIISLFNIFPYNFEVAKLAGEIARDNLNPIGFPDAAIAATAIINEAKLFTLNKKDFLAIKNLNLV